MAEGSKGTMRAFTLAGFDDAPSIHELPIPEPAAGQLLVRVQAASINGYDAAVAAGMVRDFFEYRFPVTIGKDFAGTVEALGDGAERFARGAEVVGILPRAPHVHEGTFAEYVSVPAEGFVAAKPANLGFTEAAAVGLAGTAAQVAVDAVDPSPGDRVLIVGATGGVGSFAIQLAAERGAKVTATGLPEDEETLRALGAAEIIDYSGDVAAAITERHPDGIDGVIDLATRDPDAFDRLARHVRSGGRVASSIGVADVEGLASREVKATNLDAQADTSGFEKIVAAAAEGRVRIPVERVFSLEEVPQGLELLASGKARGKFVVRVGTES